VAKKPPANLCKSYEEYDKRKAKAKTKAAKKKKGSK
jgi:hypothetical protein